jgi:hypothetical protein
MQWSGLKCTRQGCQAWEYHVSSLYWHAWVPQGEVVADFRICIWVLVASQADSLQLYGGLCILSAALLGGSLLMPIPMRPGALCFQVRTV